MEPTGCPRNVGNELPLRPSEYPRKAQFSTYDGRLEKLIQPPRKHLVQAVLPLSGICSFFLELQSDVAYGSVNMAVCIVQLKFADVQTKL